MEDILKLEHISKFRTHVLTVHTSMAGNTSVPTEMTFRIENWDIAPYYWIDTILALGDDSIQAFLSFEINGIKFPDPITAIKNGGSTPPANMFYRLAFVPIKIRTLFSGALNMKVFYTNADAGAQQDMLVINIVPFESLEHFKEWRSFL